MIRKCVESKFCSFGFEKRFIVMAEEGSFQLYVFYYGIEIEICYFSNRRIFFVNRLFHFSN